MSAGEIAHKLREEMEERLCQVAALKRALLLRMPQISRRDEAATGQRDYRGTAKRLSKGPSAWSENALIPPNSQKRSCNSMRSARLRW